MASHIVENDLEPFAAGFADEVGAHVDDRVAGGALPPTHECTMVNVPGHNRRP
jgi:hypothetical protein